jgi:tetratricopeptide (TPR) repeat protein
MTVPQASRGLQSPVAKWVGPALALAAFVVYLLTMSQYAFPGEPARLVARHTAAQPFVEVDHGIWLSVSRIAAFIPGSTLSMRLSLFSALCAAGVIYLVYAFHVRLVWGRIDTESFAHGQSVSPATKERASMVSAATAAAFTATCIPFWTIGNRPHYLAFDLLLFALAAYGSLLLLHFGKQKHYYGVCFVAGLAAVEFPGFLVASPLIAVAILWGLYAHGMLSIASLVKGGCVFIAGYSSLLVLAAYFYLDPLAQQQGLDSFRQALIYVGYKNHASLVRSIPQVGWLLTLCLCIAPWIFVVGVQSKQGADADKQKFGRRISYLVLAAVAIGILYGAPYSPWEIAKQQNTSVLPVLFLGSWAGFLAGFWYLYFCHSQRFGRRHLGYLRRKASTIYTVLLAGILVGALGYNWRRADAARGDFVSRYADLVVDQVGERIWILSVGNLLRHIRISAADAGKEIKGIDLAMASVSAYHGYLRSLHADPDIRAVVPLGIIPMLREWLAKEPEGADVIAAVAAADAVVALDLKPIPEGVYYRSGAIEKADAEALLDTHRKIWAKASFLWEDEISPPDAFLENWQETIRRILAKNANNLGVIMEDLEQDPMAVMAYEQARRINPGNVSALLNLYALNKRLESVHFRVLEQELKEWLEEPSEKTGIWTLSSVDGDVRNPVVFRRMGHSWAISGQPGRAIEAYERAKELGPSGSRMQGILGSLYFLSDDWQKSEAQFEEMLENDPNSVTGIIGLARLAAARRDLEGAKILFQKAEVAGAEPSLIAMELATAELLNGNLEKGVSLLEKNVEEYPKLEWPTALLARIKAKDNRKDAEALLKSEALARPVEARTCREVGATHSLLGNRSDARLWLMQALKLAQADTTTMEYLIKLDLEEGKIDVAKRHAVQLVNYDADNSVARFALGIYHQVRGENEEAEAHYRRSLAQTRKPQTLNNLAWLLQEKGDYEDATQLALETVQIAPEFASAWDTLGVCNLRTDNYDEAETAFHTALDFAPEMLSALLHLLELHLAKNEIELARNVASALKLRESDLQPKQLEQLGALMLRLN